METPLVHLDVLGARRLTERIRQVARGIADSVADLRAMVAEAKEAGAHELLGYSSWTAYLRDVFGDEPLRLARDVRQELVAELAAQGMSTRAIAPIVGVSKSLVADDLVQVSSSGQVEADLARDVPDLPVDLVTGEVSEAGDEDDRGEAVVVVEQSITEKTRTVTGLDGKTYTTKPSAPRRGSLIEDARNAGWQLRKAIERVQRISEDDRFGKNKAEVMAALQPHLDFANEVLSGL